MNKLKLMSGAVAALCFSTGMTAAADSLRVSGGSVQVSPSSYVKNMTLSVSGPNGFYAQEFSKNSAPRVSMMQNGQLADGVYSWHMSASTNQALPESVNPLNDGRGDIEKPQRYKSTSMSGTFVISGGTLVQQDASIEE